MNRSIAWTLVGLLILTLAGCGDPAPKEERDANGRRKKGRQVPSAPAPDPAGADKAVATAAPAPAAPAPAAPQAAISPINIGGDNDREATPTVADAVKAVTQPAAPVAQNAAAPPAAKAAPKQAAAEEDEDPRLAKQRRRRQNRKDDGPTPNVAGPTSGQPASGNSAGPASQLGLNIGSDDDNNAAGKAQPGAPKNQAKGNAPAVPPALIAAITPAKVSTPKDAVAAFSAGLLTRIQMRIAKEGSPAIIPSLKAGPTTQAAPSGNAGSVPNAIGDGAIKIGGSDVTSKIEARRAKRKANRDD